MFVTRSSSPAARSWQCAAVCAFLVSASGCATNHPFVRGAELDVPALVSALEAKSEEEEALYDITWIPFAHVDLQVFAENDETPRYPEGHAFISMRSWLPLFSILDGEIELYDADHSAYEKNEFTSLLWGLWARRRTTIPTAHGDRIANDYDLLWILDWGPSVRYEPPAED